MVELISKDIDVIKSLGEESLKTAKEEFNIIEDHEIDSSFLNSQLEDKLKAIDNKDKDEDSSLNTKGEKSLWVTKLDVNKKGIYTSTINNIVLMLENDMNLKNKIALNL